LANSLVVKNGSKIGLATARPSPNGVADRKHDIAGIACEWSAAYAASRNSGCEFAFRSHNSNEEPIHHAREHAKTRSDRWRIRHSRSPPREGIAPAASGATDHDWRERSGEGPRTRRSGRADAIEIGVVVDENDLGGPAAQIDIDRLAKGRVAHSVALGG
jgi:hypothetical protein